MAEQLEVKELERLVPPLVTAFLHSPTTLPTFAPRKVR